MLEYSLIKQHQSPVQRAAAGRQELPVPGRHPRRRMAAGRWSCGAASARASATSGRTATPTPSATRSTCCCAPFPSAPARRASSTSTTGSAAHASCSTSRSARDRASARSTTPSTTPLVEELIEFLDGDTDAVVKRLDPRDAGRRRRAGVRAGGPAARPADRGAARPSSKQQMVADRNEDLDVIGIAEDDLEAAVQIFYVRRGRVVGRKGFILDKVEDLDDHALVARILEELYGDEPPLGVPKQVLRPVRARGRRTSTRSGWPIQRATPAWTSACRSGATSVRCWRRSPATRRRSSPATGCAGPPTTTAGPGPSTSSRTCSASPKRRCASSATT